MRLEAGQNVSVNLQKKATAKKGKIKDVAYSQVSLEAWQNVSDVLSDLVGGFQTKQVEVAQQVVRHCEELEVQFGQRQTPLPCICSNSF